MRGYIKKGDKQQHAFELPSILNEQQRAVSMLFNRQRLKPLEQGSHGSLQVHCSFVQWLYCQPSTGFFGVFVHPPSPFPLPPFFHSLVCVTGAWRPGVGAYGWVAWMTVVLSLWTGWSLVEAPEHPRTQPTHSDAVVQDGTLTTFTPWRAY